MPSYGYEKQLYGNHAGRQSFLLASLSPNPTSRIKALSLPILISTTIVRSVSDLTAGTIE